MFKKIRIISLALVAVLLVGAFSGCSEKDSDDSSKDGSNTKIGDAYSKEKVGFQLDAPKAGEEIAILHTTMGDIYIRFFPEGAPKTVENFKTHIKNGYYDGLIFHRVIDNFMIQGGDPEGTGRGGESAWGGSFEDEFDKKLLNIRGSLSMANSGSNTNGSQFFINQAPASTFQGKDYFVENTKGYKASVKEYYETNKKDFSGYSRWEDIIGLLSPTLNPDADLVSDDVWKLYEENGGNISLDGAWRHDNAGHSVFAQVFKGMDVVDAIVKVETDSSDKPLTDVKITNVELTNHQ